MRSNGERPPVVCEQTDAAGERDAHGRRDGLGPRAAREFPCQHMADGWRNERPAEQGGFDERRTGDAVDAGGPCEARRPAMPR